MLSSIHACSRGRRLLPAASQLALLISIAALAAIGCTGKVARVEGAGARGPGAASAAAKPLAVPVGAVLPAEDYLLGVGDLLSIRVFELEKPGEVSTLEVDVDPQGDVPISLIGAVRAEGKTAAALRAEIARRLGQRFLVDPQVLVSVKEYRARHIGVMGAVAKPGIYFLNRNRVSVVEALILAGGLGDGAGTHAYVLRPRLAVRPPAAAAAPTAGVVIAEVERVDVDLVPLLLRGDLSGNVTVEPGSVVHVPNADEFFVSGYVQKPGAYSFRHPTTVVQAVAVAGGLDTRKASPSAVKIRRPKGSEVEIIDIDLGAITAGKAPDVPIYPGDSIEAGRTVAWAIYTDFMEVMIGRVGAGFSLGGL